MHYLPDSVIVNNIEFDHADIFSSVEDIELSFHRMLNLVPRDGLVVANAADERVMRVTEDVWCQRVTFSVVEGVEADWRAEDFEDSPAGTSFTIVGPTGTRRCTIGLHGRHNAANALAVTAMCSHLGLDLEGIAAAFESFRGVKRRLETIPCPNGYTLYDDFAHHPTAIAETLTAVRAAHPGTPVWALFEPRSNTTVKAYFQDELTRALALADHVVVGALHRKERIPAAERLDVDRLIAGIREAGKDAVQIDAPDDIAARVATGIAPGDVVVLMSNGAFGGLSALLPKALEAAHTA